MGMATITGYKEARSGGSYGSSIGRIAHVVQFQSGYVQIILIKHAKIALRMLVGHYLDIQRKNIAGIYHYRTAACYPGAIEAVQWRHL